MLKTLRSAADTKNGPMSEVIVRRLEEIEPVSCPCGESRRLVRHSDGTVASLHVTHICRAQTHFHKVTTEFYYVLSGMGSMELGGDKVEVRPGTALVIPPGTPHRGTGDFTTVVFCVPALSRDEYIVEDARR